MVGIAHPQLSLSRQLLQSHESPRELKFSFFNGQKEYKVCITSSKAPERDSSTSSFTTCAQDFFVEREPKVCSSPVPGKGNQEYVTTGVRAFLFMQVADQHRLVENTSTLRLQKSSPMGRAWSQGVVQTGSSLCAETFGAEIRRSARCGFCHPGSCQGLTHRGVSRPCSGRRLVALQIKGSHSSGQGQAAYRPRPLHP